MSTFIFIDGPDGVGKTTLCKNLLQELADKKPHFVALPSDEGALAFIREKVKNKDFQCSDTFRQSLHTMNHIERFFVSKNYETVIFDRSPASTYVYGKICNVPEQELEMLVEIQLVLLKALNLDKIRFVILEHLGCFGFKGEKDESYYEQLDLRNITELYADFSNYLWNKYQLSSDIIDVTKLNEQEIVQAVLARWDREKS